MFRRIIARLGRGKRVREFEERLSHEQDKGYVLDIARDRSWYTTLGMPVEEFAETPGGVLWLDSLDEGMVCRASLVHYVSERRILIGDIEAFVENKGYGSSMLKNIIKLARDIGVREITGNLSEVDSDHFDKLKYFYVKHGFKIAMFDGGNSGAIKYYIQ